MTYGITGATGAFGRLAVQHFLALGIAPESLVAVVRDEEKARDLKDKGIVVRRGDYTDPASLSAALQGVDRLLLVSGNEIGQRFAQHKNVMDAARKAGVRLIAYTSIIQADTSVNPLAGEHNATEEYLKATGTGWIILRNNWYAENHGGDVASARQTGVVAAGAGKGKIGSALRSEYAEAAVKALVAGEAGRTWELAGPLWDFDEFASTLGKILGTPVSYRSITEGEKARMLQGLGMPGGVAAFFAAVDTSIAAGSLAHTSGDLETLLGRRPADLETQLRSLL